MRSAMRPDVGHAVTAALGARARARARPQLRCAGYRLAGRGDPGRISRAFRQLGRPGRAKVAALAALTDRRARRPRKSSSRKPTGSPPSCPIAPSAAGRRRRLDRSRLAGRRRGLSTRRLWAPISTTACPALRSFSPRMPPSPGTRRPPNLRWRRRASSQEAEGPECGALCALARDRRRHRAGLGRLCADRDVESLNDDELLADAHVACGADDRRSDRGRQAARRDRRQRRRASSRFCASTATPGPTTC